MKPAGFSVAGRSAEPGSSILSKGDTMIDVSEPVSAATPQQARRRSSTVTATRNPKNDASGARKTLNIERVFSDPKTSPYDQLEWERRTAEITDDAGKVIFKQENVEVPKAWSLLATKVVVSKYFYGEQGTAERETSVRQLIHRICRTIADWGVKDGYFTKAGGEVFYDELTWLCLNQYGAFNSPVWFNVGLYHQYNVGNTSSRGNWYYQRKHGQAERAKTQYEYPQCSACFIQSVEDNMESIMHLAHSEAMLFKFGSGTGTDLSPLRSAKEKLSGGGKPSGPLSFLKVYDQVANVVKSGGKTRRAAKMNTLHDWHGDIEEFIEAKMKEEKKAWALIEQGYDGSYNGDAYGSVMYQNENLSVRVSDAFMQAALEGKEWWTRAVTTGKPLQKKDASTLLHKMAEGTWTCGDPGLQYDGAIQKWHTCKGTEPIHSTNPCSEYVFINNTACNLASLNLLKFKREDGTFDVERFKAAVRVFITAQEILVDNASYPTKEIAENSHIFRTLGLGYANLGSLIMSYGLPYDSDAGRALAGAITAIMTGHAYEQSAEIAGVMGAFKGYRDARCAHVSKPLSEDNVESMLQVIKQHREAVEEIQPSEEFNYLKDEARKCWDGALERGRAMGYRNAQVTVLAPTGTIAFLMDCDTTGIEPDIALVKYKLLAGGGMLKIVNRTVPEGLRRLGYSAQESERIIAHIESFDTIEDVEEGGPADRQRAEAGASAGLRLRVQGLSRPAQHSLPGAPQDDGGGPAVHQRRHFQDGQHAQRQHRRMTSVTPTCRRGRWASSASRSIATARSARSRSTPSAPTKAAIKPPVWTRSALEARIKELEAASRRACCPGRQAIAPAPHGHPHRHHPQVRHRRPRRLSHRRAVRRSAARASSSSRWPRKARPSAGLMDGIGTLTSLALQYGVPLEALVRKFAHVRFEPSGFTKNPDIRNAASITDYVFRWMAVQFIPGYREANSPNRNQPELAIPGLQEELKKKVNRPVPELAMAEDTDIVGLKSEHEGNGKGQVAAHPSPAARAVKTLSESVAHFQQDAPTCPNCGSVTVRNGACYKCLNCGESLGCS